MINVTQAPDNKTAMYPGIDAGTRSVKVALHDPDSRTLAVALCDGKQQGCENIINQYLCTGE